MPQAFESREDAYDVLAVHEGHPPYLAPPLAAGDELQDVPQRGLDVEWHEGAEVGAVGDLAHGRKAEAAEAVRGVALGVFQQAVVDVLGFRDLFTTSDMLKI